MDRQSQLQHWIPRPRRTWSDAKCCSRARCEGRRPAASYEAAPPSSGIGAAAVSPGCAAHPCPAAVTAAARRWQRTLKRGAPQRPAAWRSLPTAHPWLPGSAGRRQQAGQRSGMAQQLSIRVHTAAHPMRTRTAVRADS
eukprot:365725-Chlamydomonas_euryale.AAC.43